MEVKRIANEIDEKKPLCPSLTVHEAIGEGFTYAKTQQTTAFLN